MLFPFTLGLVVAGGLLLPTGLVCLRALVAATRSEFEWSKTESAFFATLLGLALVSGSALLLAEIGVFSVYGLLGTVLSITLLSLLFIRVTDWKRRRHSESSPLLSNFLIVFLIVLSGFLFFQPFEYFLGGMDPGVYVNTAVSILKNGSIIYLDKEIAGVSETARQVLFTYVPSPWVRSGLAGFTVLDFQSGALEPHGFHLFPSWLAAMMSVSGVQLGLAGIPLLATLSVVASFLLGKRLFGPIAGLIAAILLATNLSQVWYSRFPAAEIMVQAFLLGGLIAFLIMLEKRNSAAAAIAGLAFGAIHLAKIEIVFLPAALIAYFCILRIRNELHSEHLVFWLVYLTVVSYAIVHALVFAPAYIIGTIEVFLPRLNFNSLAFSDPNHPYTAQFLAEFVSDNISTLLLGFAVVMALTIVTETIRRGGYRYYRRVSSIHSLSPYFLAFSVLTVAFYAYFIRPIGSDHWAGTDLTNPDSTSFVRVGWYLSRPGLLLAILGVSHLTLKRFDRITGFFLLLGGFAIIQTLSESRIGPFQFWAGRRLVPFVIPFFTLMVSYLVVRFWNLKPRIIRISLIIAPVLLLVILNFRAVWPFLWHVEYQGSLDQISAFSRRIPSNGVLLVEWSSYSGRIATPLKFIFDKSIFALSQESLRDPGLPVVIDEWLAGGKRVYWLASSSDFVMKSPGRIFEPEGQVSFVMPEAESTTERLPATINMLEMKFTLYEVTRDQQEIVLNSN